MTSKSHSPTTVRGRALFAVGSASALFALGFATAAPASADTEPDPSWTHWAQARLADSTFCGTDDPEVEYTTVGEVHTDRDGAEASTTWDDHDWSGGPGEFPTPPSSAVSNVSLTEDALESSAALEDLVVEPPCLYEEHNGEVDYFNGPVLTVDSVTSTSSWSPDGGATTDASVEGLSLLGEDFEIAPGETVSNSVTEEYSNGTYEMWAEATLNSNATGAEEGTGNTTASSSLMVTFGMDFTASDGGEDWGSSFDADFGFSGVHSDYPSEASDDPDPTETDDPDPTGTDDPDPTETDDPDPTSTEDDGGDDDGDDGGLPVTGAALGGLIAAAAAALGGGGLAMRLSRRRKDASAEDSGLGTE